MYPMANDYTVGVQTVSDSILDNTKAIKKHMLHRSSLNQPKVTK